MKIKIEESNLVPQLDLMRAIHVCAKKNGSEEQVGLASFRHENFVTVHCNYTVNNPRHTIGYYSVLVILDYLHIQGKIRSTTNQTNLNWFSIRVEKEEEEKLIMYLLN